MSSGVSTSLILLESSNKKSTQHQKFIFDIHNKKKLKDIVIVPKSVSKGF